MKLLLFNLWTILAIWGHMVPCMANDSLLSNCIAVSVAKAGARPDTLAQRAILTDPDATDRQREVAAMRLQAIHNAAIADGKLEHLRIMAMRNDEMRRLAEMEMQRIALMQFYYRR